ncbi:hypothetical protein K443DRAFT_636290 [Laccaria amethystina LaAM-08-1]|uniref:Uncharacterized protein n=1 Tax=Laccaria amethystina LaAM-08-1 TaxID=1095629 RepID=A0A0C9XBX0_9AGAR|nr:hypothetical protein K443DRAFT_636290 [Laccaria amethystina LaAM-08-1]
MRMVATTGFRSKSYSSITNRDMNGDLMPLAFFFFVALSNRTTYHHFFLHSF